MSGTILPLDAERYLFASRIGLAEVSYLVVIGAHVNSNYNPVTTFIKVVTGEYHFIKEKPPARLRSQGDLSDRQNYAATAIGDLGCSTILTTVGGETSFFNLGGDQLGELMMIFMPPDE